VTNPSRVSPFDNLAAEYDAWFEEEGRDVFGIEVEAFRELMPFLPKPWLEVGVGSGRFAQALGIDTGLDPSARLLDLAKRRGVNTVVGRGEEAVFEPGSFATVFLIVTICFVDSPLEVLKQVERILKPDGRVVLGLVLKESPWGRYYQEKKRHGHRFYQHATFYSYREVESLLGRAGFAVQECVSTLFQAPGEVRTAEGPRRGYHPDAGFTVIVAAKESALQRGRSAEPANRGA